MKNKKFILMLACFFTLFLFLLNGCSSSSSPTAGGGGGSITVPTATPTATQGSGGGSYTGGSIIIRSDSEFLPEKGVVSGSGISGDPYIIEGWTIDASAFDTSNWPYVKVGIAIYNTTKYFIIRNCTIHNAGNYGDGIFLQKVKNGKIQNCEIYDCGSGIATTQYCQNIEISGNNIHNCDDGFANGSLSSQSITISGNTINACTSHGIYFHYLESSTATNNIITNCTTGIYASALSFGGCIISSNSVQSSSAGIEISNDSEGNTVTTNNITGNTYEGIAIRGLKNTITNNISNGNGTGILVDPPVGGINPADENLIDNNTANNNQGDGFYLGSNCQNNTVSNNTFLNNNQSGGWYYDMDINNNSNTFSNNTYGTIYHP